jgi:hypothetical protein
MSNIKDELHKLLIRFSSGIKRTLQQINNVSNIFSFEVIKESQKAYVDIRQQQVHIVTLRSAHLLHIDFNKIFSYQRPNWKHSFSICIRI